MKVLARLILCLFLTSCLMPPPPHYHRYEAVEDNLDFKFVFVFCTPRRKTFHVDTIEDQSIKISSSLFNDHDFKTLKYEDFFGRHGCQMTIEMKRKVFSKNFKNDTLLLRLNNSKNLSIFLPVK